MAATAQLASSSVAVSALSSKRSEISGGNGVQALPVLRSATALPPLRLTVVASGKKFTTKKPYGPSGGTKFRGGLDASGSKEKGRGVYQFGKKYGANVDGYSPIWTPSEWSKGGEVYAGGQFGLALWAVTFAALLLVGGVLVYNTSALS